MAYVKNWLHCVWGTKSKIPFLKGKIKKDILDHIKTNAKLKGIYIDIINGNNDHIHCLVSLNPDHSLSHIMQLIKGESSFWINRNRLTKYKFEWADEYFGVSVSESQVPTVHQYIKNQEEHHKIITFREEFMELLKEQGIAFEEKYLV